MGEAKDEIVGKTKRMAGAVTGNEQLRAEGQEQDEKAQDQDEKHQNEQVGTLTGSDGVRPYSWQQSQHGSEADDDPQLRGLT